MNRSLVRAAACTLAAVGLTVLLLAVPASTPSEAASIVLNNCSSPQISGPDGSGNFTLTCGTGGGGGGAFTCSPGLSRSSPTVSQTETISANCTGGTTPYTYAWSGGGSGGCPAVPASSTSSSVTLAAPNGQSAIGPCSNYTLNANDSATGSYSGNAPSFSYSVSTGGGGGGGGGSIVCDGMTTPAGVTISNTATISNIWNASGLVTASGMGPNSALVVPFTTGAAQSGTGKGSFALSIGSSYVPIITTLSASACDFGNGLQKKQGGTTKMNFTVGLASPILGTPNLAPNTPYFLNVQVAPPPGCSTCNVQVEITKNGQ